VSLILKHWAMHYQLLSHVRWRKFLAWHGEIEPVNLEGLHCLQVSKTLLFVLSHWLMSAISFPTNSTLSLYEGLLVFSAVVCQGFDNCDN
jgi:hypothetical protein